MDLLLPEFYSANMDNSVEDLEKMISFIYEDVSLEVLLSFTFQFHQDVMRGLFNEELDKLSCTPVQVQVVDNGYSDTQPKTPQQSICCVCKSSVAATQFPSHTTNCFRIDRYSKISQTEENQSRPNLIALEGARRRRKRRYRKSRRCAKKSTDNVNTEGATSEPSAEGTTSVNSNQASSSKDKDESPSVTQEATTNADDADENPDGNDEDLGTDSVQEMQAFPFDLDIFDDMECSAITEVEKSVLLNLICGVVSQYSGKLCTRSLKCAAHTNEQRLAVRQKLLCTGDSNKSIIDCLTDESNNMLNMSDVDLEKMLDFIGQAFNEKWAPTLLEPEQVSTSTEQNAPQAAKKMTGKKS